MDRAQELRDKIRKYEQMYEKRKGKLVLKTLAVLSVVFYIAAFCFGWMHEPLDFLGGIIISAVAAVAIFYIGIIAMIPLINSREDEITTLTRLKTELEFVEKGLLRNDTKKPEKSTVKKKDIKICLSNPEETPKATGNFNIYGNDMRLEPKGKSSN